VPLRPPVQEQHRPAPPPVRHRPPRRARQGAAARPGPPPAGRGRRRDRFFQPESFHPPLQAPRRGYAQVLPIIGKNASNDRKLVISTTSPPLLPFFTTGTRNSAPAQEGERRERLDPTPGR